MPVLLLVLGMRGTEVIDCLERFSEKEELT
jgi:hypothetical protein